MIISHQYEYIFIELPRTGTTAIHKELLEKYGGKEILYKHATYREFLKNASSSEKDYFVFSCIRNPLDRVVSLFLKMKYKQGVYSDKAFKEKRGIIQKLYFDRRFKYIQKYNANFSDYFKKFFIIPYDDFSCLDHSQFDYVIQFENLQNDFSEVLELLNIKQKRPLPVINKTDKKEDNYLKYFTNNIRRKSVKIFGPWMSLNNYDLPKSWERYPLNTLDFIRFKFFRLLRKFFYLYIYRLNK